MHKFHADAGHGWLEVPISELVKKGIDKQITKCSYMDVAKGLAYLEEDIDMATFVGDDFGLEYEEVYSERSFIRDLERYKPV